MDGNLDWISPEIHSDTKWVGMKANTLFAELRREQKGVLLDADQYENDPEFIAYKTALQNILSGKTQEEATEFKTPGTERWFRTRYLPLMHRTRSGGIEGESFIDGIVAASIDITELRVRDAELKKKEKEKLAAKEASRMKSQFLGR